LLIAVLGAVQSSTAFPGHFRTSYPIVSVVWQFLPAFRRRDRIPAPPRQRRVLTTSVNGIRQIESQSLDGVRRHSHLLLSRGLRSPEAEPGDQPPADPPEGHWPPGITPPFLATAPPACRSSRSPSARHADRTADPRLLSRTLSFSTCTFPGAGADPGALNSGSSWSTSTRRHVRPRRVPNDVSTALATRT